MKRVTEEARILEVTSYPPPRAGWGVRVEFVKKGLEREGHRCVVLNIGVSRAIPSDEYETVLGGADFVRKVWRYSGQGFVVHAHANGDAVKGLLLALLAELINLSRGRRCILTFHAGAIQRYFPQNRWLAPVFWLLFTIPRRIICNSSKVKACIAGYGISEKKIVPIPAFSRQYLEFTPAVLPEHLRVFLHRYPIAVFTYLRMRHLFFPTTLIEGMARVMANRPDTGLIVCGGQGHSDDGVWHAVERAIRHHHLNDRVCFVDDLDHDAFLTMLQQSALYLRTPITDGVASSVLEAMALGVPVVACENGARPPGVITYPADDAERLAQAVNDVLGNGGSLLRCERAAVGLDKVDVPDTVAEEIRLLTAPG
jgi:glycosyltransferase involved in cell wall biosynthesis